MVYIYTLSHPETLEIRYIGVTNNIKIRYKNHINPYGNTHKECWVKSLLKQGLKPIISIIDEFSTHEEAYEFESYWIQQFKTWGFNLVNHSEGGKGNSGNNVSQETKDKISKTLKDKYSKEPHKLKGRKHSEEHKKARSKRMKGKIPPCSFKGKKHSKSVRKVVQVYKDGILIDTLDSVLETSKKYNVNAGAISNVCRGKCKTAKDYTFKYKE